MTTGFFNLFFPGALNGGSDPSAALGALILGSYFRGKT